MFSCRARMSLRLLKVLCSSTMKFCGAVMLGLGIDVFSRCDVSGEFRCVKSVLL